MKILKKIGLIVIDVLVVIVFIVSALVVVANITATRENGQANVFGYAVNSVQSDSMQGEINRGDLVVSRVIPVSEKKDIILENGQIVSFFVDINEDSRVLVTHRIVDVTVSGNTEIYTTRGDNVPEGSESDPPKTIYEIESVYLFKIPLLGHFIDFLKLPIGFILCLVLPLLAFIAWQTYKLVSLYLKSKKLELAEKAEKAQSSSSEISDADKEAIIAEYLAKQKEETEASKDADASDDPPNEEKAEAEEDPSENSES